MQTSTLFILLGGESSPGQVLDIKLEKGVSQALEVVREAQSLVVKLTGAGVEVRPCSTEGQRRGERDRSSINKE